ncbi:MAG TPA: 16S rRNA (adenine(1518)-N(6)/adenine(1519)-N(6))-dimethyltransferase RsmA [Candidatus Eisenbacteria bacterium]|nr:16S rRNA (adenine(1518)-N(6)/adenine(1519)-N(6))-dimethyltransferase RsmA [Candidatus Eisenbacteria bacterium]
MPRLALSSGSRGTELKERAPRDAGAARAAGAATSGVPAALRAIGVRPSRRLGQNFLIDPRVAERIVALVEDPREAVIEIGPGLGALTTLLAATGRELTAVELDLRLAEALETRLAVWPAARVVRGDILEQRAEDLASGPATVVANLPYSITTPALEWIVTQGGRVKRAVLMVQREYAQRLSAKPGGKEHGSITVFLQLHAEVRVLFRVSPGAFHPRPEVDSVVLEVVPRPYPGTTAEERASVERLARAGMGTRRKTLANALGRALGMEGAVVRAWLGAAGVDPERRGETLTVDEWIALARVAPRRMTT